MTSTELTPIAIIVLGEKTPGGRKFFEKHYNRDKSSYLLIDIRAWLAHDPQAHDFKVPHPHDSRFLPCQLGFAVRQKHEFVKCVKEVVGMINANRDDVRVVVLECTAGKHRSDSVSRCSADRVFNYESAEQPRVFNANVFSLLCAESDGAVEAIVAQAWAWLDTPWCVTPTDPKWGEQAAIVNKDWNDAMTDIDEFGREFVYAVWYETRCDEGHQGFEDVSKGTLDAAPWRTASVASSSSAYRNSTPSPIGARPQRGGMRCPFCEGSGIRSQTRVDCPKAMSHGLSALGVDKFALVTWQALYYSSEFGQTKAMTIADSVLYTSDIDNPSAFMWNHCGRAWMLLQGQSGA